MTMCGRSMRPSDSRTFRSILRAAWRFGSRTWFAAALGRLTELAYPGSRASMRRDQPLRWRRDHTRIATVGGLMKSPADWGNRQGNSARCFLYFLNEINDLVRHFESHQPPQVHRAPLAQRWRLRRSTPPGSPGPAPGFLFLGRVR